MARPKLQSEWRNAGTRKGQGTEVAKVVKGYEVYQRIMSTRRKVKLPMLITTKFSRPW